MKLKDFESRMVHDGKRNNREVLVSCKRCGKQTWKRWQRVKSGGGEFCSLGCFNKFQAEEGRKLWGKENVYFYFDKLKKRWIARWRDKHTGEFHVQHRSKFIWEQIYGEVPDGYDIHHVDGDIENDNLENLEMVKGSLHKQGIHGSNRRIVDGIVHKQCYRCKRYFPENEYTHSYCKSCQKEYMREYRKDKNE